MVIEIGVDIWSNGEYASRHFLVVHVGYAGLSIMSEKAAKAFLSDADDEGAIVIVRLPLKAGIVIESKTYGCDGRRDSAQPGKTTRVSRLKFVP